MAADHDTGISNKREIQFIRDDVTGRLIFKFKVDFLSHVLCSQLELVIAIGIVREVELQPRKSHCLLFGPFFEITKIDNYSLKLCYHPIQ